MSYLNVSRRLLFVHLYKNAGSSVVAALRAFCPNDLDDSPPCLTGRAWLDRRLDRRWLRGRGYVAVARQRGLDRLRALEALATGHLSIKQFEENLDLRPLESFAVVRNPWAWQVSLFNYARTSARHYQHGEPQYADFDRYVRWRCTDEVRLQSHFLESHRGGIGVRHLLRFESLSGDWDRLRAATGWALAPLEHRNRSTFDDWRSYYTDETAELVGRTFARDVELFGYRFDN